MGKILRNKDLSVLRWGTSKPFGSSAFSLESGSWLFCRPARARSLPIWHPRLAPLRQAHGGRWAAFLRRDTALCVPHVSFRQLRSSLRDRTPFAPTSRIVPVCAFCILSKGHSSHDFDFFRRSLWKSQKQGAEPGSSLRSGVTIYSTDHLEYLRCDDTG